MPTYVPRRGDFVILASNSPSGRGQKGGRPALIVSNTLFNKRMGLAMVCPITNAKRDIPFRVEAPGESPLTWYVMAERINTVDYTCGKVKFVGKAPAAVLNEVLSLLDACLYSAD
ncbi:MAG: type II toxin-antitoxin system PemK/MazF family toxin [Halieaceae bacterium]|nr:type II toxin-antitoxin system PemK/MazF family toxin [Halieaceae bacterium]